MTWSVATLLCFGAGLTSIIAAIVVDDMPTGPWLAAVLFAAGILFIICGFVFLCGAYACGCFAGEDNRVLPVDFRFEETNGGMDRDRL